MNSPLLRPRAQEVVGRQGLPYLRGTDCERLHPVGFEPEAHANVRAPRISARCTTSGRAERRG